jgi:uncharacterized protein YndB with AHSA1/START domain
VRRENDAAIVAPDFSDHERKPVMTATGTVRLHRVLRCTPDKLYRAFVEPGAMARWLPPYGFICTVERMDVRVGGSFRMAFTNFSSGKSHAFGGDYLELVPGERIVYTDRFDDPSMPGTMRTSVQLRTVACGTELSVEQSGIPAMIPVEMCYLGWQESLEQLARLVEPVIPD